MYVFEVRGHLMLRDIDIHTNTHILFKNTGNWLPLMALPPYYYVFVQSFIFYKRRTNSAQEKGQGVKASLLMYGWKDIKTQKQ